MGRVEREAVEQIQFHAKGAKLFRKERKGIIRELQEIAALLL